MSSPFESGAEASRRRADGRWARPLAGGALVCCLGLSFGLLLRGSDLDSDSILPFQPGQEEGTTTITGPTGPESPSAGAQVILSLLVAVTALPVLAPRKAFRHSLGASMFLVAAFVLLTALRLGLLFVPVLALQIAAYVQVQRTDGAGSRDRRVRR